MGALKNRDYKYFEENIIEKWDTQIVEWVTELPNTVQNHLILITNGSKIKMSWKFNYKINV